MQNEPAFLADIWLVQAVDCEVDWHTTAAGRDVSAASLVLTLNTYHTTNIYFYLLNSTH